MEKHCNCLQCRTTRLLFTAVFESFLFLYNFVSPGIRKYAYTDDIARENPLIRDAILSVEDGSILDVGAGMSTAAPFLARKETEVVRLDIDENMLDVGDSFFELSLRSKGVPSYRNVVADAHNMPFQKNSFDMVLAIASLREKGETDNWSAEYIEYPESDIERVLKQGGDLVVGSSNLEDSDTDEYLERTHIPKQKFEETVADKRVLWLKNFRG